MMMVCFLSRLQINHKRLIVLRDGNRPSGYMQLSTVVPTQVVQRKSGNMYQLYILPHHPSSGIMFQIMTTPSDN